MGDPAESIQPSTLRTVGRNTGILFGSQTVTWVISAFVMAIVPRFLGPVAVGQLAVPTAFWVIASVFVGWGTSRLATLESARNPETAGEIIGPGLRMRVVLGVLSLVVLVSFSLVVYSRQIVIVTAIIGVSTLLYAIADLGRAVLTGLQRAGAMARIDVADKLVAAVVMITLVAWTRDLYAAAAASVIAGLAAVVITRRAVSREVHINYGASHGDVRRLIRLGSPFLFMGLALIAYQQVDTIVMSMLVDDIQIGWYGAADRLFGTLLFAPVIMMTALLPALTREHDQNSENARAIVGRAFDVLLVIAVPIGLLTVVCARPFVELLFGEEFEEAGDVLAVLGIVLLFTFFSMLFGSYATASNRQRLWNAVMVAAVVASILLDLVLVPFCDREFDNGGIGGALAFVVTEAGMVAIGLWRVVPGLLTRVRVVRIAKCLLAGAGLLGAAWIARDQFFLVGAVAGGALYALLAALLRVLDQDEIDALKSIVASRRSG